MFSAITLAGLPEAMQRAGILVVTTLLAEIIAPSPIVTPLVILTLEHIHTWSPMMTGALSFYPLMMT